MQDEIKQVIFSVALSGLSFVDALVPGVLPFGQAQADDTPSVVSRTFGAYLADDKSIFPLFLATYFCYSCVYKGGKTNYGRPGKADDTRCPERQGRRI